MQEAEIAKSGVWRRKGLERGVRLHLLKLGVSLSLWVSSHPPSPVFPHSSGNRGSGGQ